MLSRRVRANMANGKRSKGPKTAAGKAKSSKNALRHGLAVPLMIAVENVSDDVERCAKLLAGPEPSLERRELAQRVAEAQLDLLRIRRARMRLLGDERARTKQPSAQDLIHTVKELGSNLKRPDGALDERAQGVLKTLGGIAPGAEPLTLTEGIGVLIPELERLDRYERRALSRRRKAIEALSETR